MPTRLDVPDGTNDILDRARIFGPKPAAPVSREAALAAELRQAASRTPYPKTARLCRLAADAIDDLVAERDMARQLADGFAQATREAREMGEAAVALAEAEVAYIEAVEAMPSEPGPAWDAAIERVRVASRTRRDLAFAYRAATEPVRRASRAEADRCPSCPRCGGPDVACDC